MNRASWGARAALPATLVGAVLCAACGDSTRYSHPGAPALVRIKLVKEAGALIEREATTVHRFDFGQPLPEDWEVEGDEAELTTEEDPRFGGPWTGVLVDERGTTSITIPLQLEPGEVNRAAVRLVCKSKIDVRVSLIRDGETVIQSPFLRYAGDGKPGLVVVELPGGLAQTKAFDSIALRIHRLKHDGVLLSLDLIRIPLASSLPDPTSGSAPVAMLQEYRDAVGLSRDYVLSGEFEAPAHGVLRFGFGKPPAVLRAGERAFIRVRVQPLDGVGKEITRRLGLHERRNDPQSGAWRDASIPLENSTPQRLKLTLALETRSQGESLVAIASPRVERRGENARTVVLVTSDTHRADHLGAVAAGVGVQTPFLDALAGRGVMFEDAYASTNITNPSHASLLTALSPRDTGMVDNNTVLSGAALTLAEIYRDAGYMTLAALSAGHMRHDQSGLGQGFDRLWVPKGKQDVDSSISISQLDQWLDDADRLPLFVWLHVFDAHAPYEVPDDLRWLYYDKRRNPYDKALGPLPTGARVSWDVGVQDIEYVLSQYMSEVTYLDAQIEAFLSNARFGAAIVAVTGDHGESLGNHGLYFTHRGLYPNTLAVPLILAWPGGPQQVKVTRGVDHLDLGRTLLDLSGINDAKFPGQNLLRWVEEPQRPPEARFAISSQGHSASIESEGWFLVLNLLRSTKPNRVRHQVELYRLADDPGCLDDLVDAQPERARKMRLELIRWLGAALEGGLSSSTSVMSVETLAQLAALGYATDNVGQQRNGDGGWYTPDPRNPWCARFK